MNMKRPPSDWYKEIWTLGIKENSWVEDTQKQVDFIINALNLSGKERILDLACGYGRHSLEFARRGYSVVGVDITQSFIKDATESAKKENLNVEFICTDIRNYQCKQEFDVVLNMADGAIGYLENDAENNKIFEVIGKALKPGGKSLIDICNQLHAVMHFPKKYWEIGTNQIALPWFDYNESDKRMLYGGFDIPFGAPATPPQSLEAHSSIRLYSYEEVKNIFYEMGISVLAAYGDYSLNVLADHKHMQLIIVSEKPLA